MQADMSSWFVHSCPWGDGSKTHAFTTTPTACLPCLIRLAAEDDGSGESEKVRYLVLEIENSGTRKKLVLIKFARNLDGALVSASHQLHGSIRSSMQPPSSLSSSHSEPSATAGVSNWWPAGQKWPAVVPKMARKGSQNFDRASGVTDKLWMYAGYWQKISKIPWKSLKSCALRALRSSFYPDLGLCRAEIINFRYVRVLFIQRKR